MKKTELKSIIKPLVKECIQETLLEEGLLSSVISEVVKGLGTHSVLQEEKPADLRPSQPNHAAAEFKQQMQREKESLLASINKDAYNGVNIFEGTEPLTSYEASTTASTRGGALTGVPPNDPGVDISGILAVGGKNWKALMG